MERLQEIADLRRQYGCKFLISVDGGIDHERCLRCREIGVDMIVGTVHNIFKQPDGLKARVCGLRESSGRWRAGSNPALFAFLLRKFPCRKSGFVL